MIRHMHVDSGEQCWFWENEVQFCTYCIDSVVKYPTCGVICMLHSILMYSSKQSCLCVCVCGRMCVNVCVHVCVRLCLRMFVGVVCTRVCLCVFVCEWVM